MTLILTDEEKAEIAAVNERRRQNAAARSDWPEMATLQEVDLGDGAIWQIRAIDRALTDGKPGTVRRVHVVRATRQPHRLEPIPGSLMTYSAGSWAELGLTLRDGVWRA